jgi:hypothetical protein
MKISGHGLECRLNFSQPDREGWMQATVQIKAPAFEGNFTCYVEKKEWQVFVGLLQHLDTSAGKEVEASWENMEANIAFQFRLYKPGNLEGQYEFCPVAGVGPTLSGTFEADQSYLPGWIRSAQQVLESTHF